VLSHRVGLERDVRRLTVIRSTTLSETHRAHITVHGFSLLPELFGITDDSVIRMSLKTTITPTNTTIEDKRYFLAIKFDAISRATGRRNRKPSQAASVLVFCPV
jgi:hypothetical protein